MVTGVGTTPLYSGYYYVDPADFLTREGEGRRGMGDCLRDKSIPWETRRRLLQTNSGTFPCETRLHKWGKHPDGICGLCKRCREMGLGFLGGEPTRALQVIWKVACADSKLRRPLVRTTIAFSKCKRTCVRPVQCARNGTLFQKSRNSQWGGSWLSTLHLSRWGRNGVFSNEDETEVWSEARSETIDEVYDIRYHFNQ